jgi:large exoprotein involved in heme utilization and adhesion
VSLTNAGRIDASAQEQGTGGNIQVVAADRVRVSGIRGAVAGGLVSYTAANSPGGNITIYTDRLFVEAGAWINAGVTPLPGLSNVAVGGNINIIATDSIEVDGSSPVFGFPRIPDGTRLPSSIFTSNFGVGDGVGTSGSLQIQTQALTLSGGGIVSTAAIAQGSTGDIRIHTQSLEISGISQDGNFPSAVSADTFGSGNGGNITIDADRIFLRNGGVVTASSYQDGNTGKIEINAQEILDIRGQTVRGFASGIYAQSFGNGKSNEISVTVPHLSLSDQATLTAATGNVLDSKLPVTALFPFYGVPTIVPNARGEGGNIILNTHTLNLTNGANITATTASLGKAGNITIASDGVNIGSGAGIAVNSLGTQTGGNLTLSADNVTLRDTAFISALTRSSSGGNINLNIQEQLILHDHSLISTEAGTAQAGGNGGNIDLDARLITGTRNSDIIANAFAGNGGSINISAQGLFGFAVENVNDPLEDTRSNITASSRFGASGTTNINRSVDPSKGLASLPNTLVDVSDLIDDRCAVTSAAGNSRFSATGRGGLPSSPLTLPTPLFLIPSQTSPSRPHPPGPSPKKGEGEPDQKVRANLRRRLLIVCFYKFYKNLIGSTGSPSSRTSKCRWGPVE